MSVESPSSSSSRATLVELWKRSEQIRFEQHLREVEKAQQTEFRASLSRVKQIEGKLKSKMLELESREREIAVGEVELKKAKEEMKNSLKRQSDDHQSLLKQLNDQHAFALKLEREKLRAEEGRRKQLELDLVNSTRETSSTSNARELELELRMKQFELQQAADRERALLKSRDHFRTSVLKLTAEKNSSNGEQSSKLIRLQQKRAELISSGLYREGDDVIAQIDFKIDQTSSYYL